MLEEEKELLEEEKELLEERVRELTVQLEQAQSSKPAASVAEELGELDAGNLASQLTESQEQMQDMQQSIQDYEQQVDFLNSVIADLQQKLEAAEALSLMQPGELAAGMSEEEGVDQLPPPRLFCDICDQFDLHDTDDCPLQAASDSPPPSSYHDTRAPGGSDRPYCNTCEIFGHWTEDCEYEMTY
jgi:CAP-Gly domain-containing linker protein 1